MLSAHHVLRLCRVDGGGGKEEAWEKLWRSATPGTKDHSTHSKRQRLPPTNRGNGTTSFSSGGSAQAVGINAHPQSVECALAAACAAAPPLQDAAPVGHAPYPGGTPWQASLLYGYVHQCLEALVALHPVCKCIHDTQAAELACAIFRHCYLRQGPAERAVLEGQHILAQATLAASFWLALKFVATRSTIPDAQLLYRITGIPSAFLRHQEREILATLGWDLMTPAREAGAVGAADVLTDAVCREQQQQLALIARHMLPPGIAPAEAQQAPWLDSRCEQAHWRAPDAALPAAAAAAVALTSQQRPQPACSSGSSVSMAVLLAGNGAGRALPGNLLGAQCLPG